jgi:hypothetical protein
MSDDAFECARCGQEVPGEQIVMVDAPPEPWCRACYDNYEPGDPPTEEECATFRQHHYGEGIDWRGLKGF